MNEGEYFNFRQVVIAVLQSSASYWGDPELNDIEDFESLSDEELLRLSNTKLTVEQLW